MYPIRMLGRYLSLILEVTTLSPTSTLFCESLSWKVGARIIARDSGNWFHAFTINKGTDDGLAVDMNVIADGGLVGRIVDIGSNWAKVNAVINDDSNVSGMWSCVFWTVSSSICCLSA